MSKKPYSVQQDPSPAAGIKDSTNGYYVTSMFLVQLNVKKRIIIYNTNVLNNRWGFIASSADVTEICNAITFVILLPASEDGRVNLIENPFVVPSTVEKS